MRKKYLSYYSLKIGMTIFKIRLGHHGYAF